MSAFRGWLRRKKRPLARDLPPLDVVPPLASVAATIGAEPPGGPPGEPMPANAARAQKIRLFLERGPDEARRVALDESDRLARETNTFGSKQHRAQRDRIEQEHDQARRACERLSDDELDRALADAR